MRQLIDETPKNLIVLKAMSAGFHGGDYARIYVNDKLVECGKNEHNH